MNETRRETVLTILENSRRLSSSSHNGAILWEEILLWKAKRRISGENLELGDHHVINIIFNLFLAWDALRRSN
jgi:hypothetical protein